MLFLFSFSWEATQKQECFSSSCAQLQVSQRDSQSVSQSVGQSGQFFFSTESLPVSAWCNSIVKFYLEMSASPSGCMLAVIVLSISTALAFLLPLPLVKSWQRAKGEERWGRVREKERILLLCVSLIAHLSLSLQSVLYFSLLFFLVAFTDCHRGLV